MEREFGKTRNIVRSILSPILMEGEESPYDNFFSWLSNRMGVKVEPDNYLGSGYFGVVYSVGKGIVLKLTNTEVSNQHPIINKNINGVAKVYQTGIIKVPKKFVRKRKTPYVVHDYYGSITYGLKNIMDVGYNNEIGYILLEQLDTSVKYDLGSLEDIIKDFLKKKGYIGSPFIMLQRAQQNDMLIKSLIDYINFDNFGEKYKKFKSLLLEFIDVLKNVSEYYDFTDIHSGQFGRSKVDGKLKVFDLSSEFEGRNFKKPKNYIREGHGVYGTFLNWLSYRLGININDDNYLDSGAYGFVHSIGRGKVIKITNSEVANQNPIINKNIDGVAKVYQTGLIKVPKKFIYIDERKRKYVDRIRVDPNNQIGYIILEGLDTESVDDLLDDIDFVMDMFLGEGNYSYISNLKKAGGFDDEDKNFYILSKYMNDDNFVNCLKDFLTKNGKSKLIPLLNELIHVLMSVKNHYDFEDIHPGQFGRSKVDGKLKAFDLSSDEETRVFKDPKNYIKEVED